nr:hypothetical protein [Tanacetum cinerariifolium]
MSSQQDIYAAGFENRPPILNKENYLPWSSRLLMYAKSRPNGKLIHNFIINGQYIRRMIPEPGDLNREVLVNETFHVQTDDELTKKELKQLEADDQAIQTILLRIQEKKAKLFNEWERFTSNDGESIESYYHRFLKLMNDLKRNKYFPKKIASNLKFLNNLQPEWSRHVTIVHQTKDLHTADYTQLYDFLKYNQKEVDDLKAGRLARSQDPLALMATSNNPYTFPVPYQDQPSFSQNYMQQPMPNPEGITDPTTAMNMALALMAKGFKLNYSTLTNNNQRISSNPRNRQTAQPGMNMGQDRQMQMVGGNGGNQFRQYAGQNVRNLNGYNAIQNVENQVTQNAIQNLRVQNVGNQNGLIGIQGNANQNPNGNGNLIVARAEGNATRYNGNQIRCYNCRGLGHFARKCTVRPRRRDAAYLQTQLLIAQKEEAGIQLQAGEFDLMAVAADLDEIEEVNANYGSVEVHNYENCYDNEIFNMFTQEEQYTELLEPIFEPLQVPQNDNNIISKVSNVVQSGGTVEQHPVNAEETRVLYDSLYHNLAIEVEKVNTVNRKLRETNAELTSKQIMTLNEEISDLNKQLSKEKSIVSFLLEEKKKLKSDFKICEDELLDKQIQLEKKIKELDNILVKTGQSIQTIHMLSPKPDSFTPNRKWLWVIKILFISSKLSRNNRVCMMEKCYLKSIPVVHDSEKTLQIAQESRQKIKQLNKEIKPTNYTKINHLSGVFVSQTANSREELYFSNTSKTANVSKPISIPNEEFSDDTTPSVARKFLNEVKSTIVTLQRVVKQRMTLETHNWSSSAHQELHKIVKDEIFPIVNQVDARVQNFDIQFLKEASKFVGDCKSLTKEADESLAKHKALKLEIRRLLRAVVSQDIMSVVQNNSVGGTSNLQTEFERTKERFEIISLKRRINMLNFGMTGIKNVKNVNSIKFRTIKLTMTCNKKSNGCKLS